MRKMQFVFFMIPIKSLLNRIKAKYIFKVNNYDLWPVLKPTAYISTIERTAHGTEQFWTASLVLNRPAVSAGEANFIYMGIDSNGIFVYMSISCSQIIRFAVDVECHTKLRKIEDLISSASSKPSWCNVSN